MVVVVKSLSGDEIDVSVPRDPTTQDFSKQLALKCKINQPRIFKDGEELHNEQHIGGLLSGASLSDVQLCDDPACEYTLGLELALPHLFILCPRSETLQS